MKRNMFVFLVACTALSTSGCVGTLSGIVAGPTMGGTSLTGKLYKSNSAKATKVIGTPFAFAGGTIGGIFPAVHMGFAKDTGDYCYEFSEIFDPFSAGLFR